MTVDPERDLVFSPTGSAARISWGGLRPGDELYANSLVALRASSGELQWHFQMVHHDLWDYDLASPPALITVTREGRSVPAVAQGTKMGYVFILDRETGEPLFPVEERPAPPSDVAGETASPTQPVPVRPRPLVPQRLGPEDAWGLTPLDRAACRARIERLRSDGIFTPPSRGGSIVYPGFLGGIAWGGMAFDPRSGLLVTNTNNVAMVATLVPASRVARTEIDASGKVLTARQAPAPYAVRRDPALEAALQPTSVGIAPRHRHRHREFRWEVPRAARHARSTPARGAVNLGSS